MTISMTTSSAPAGATGPTSAPEADAALDAQHLAVPSTVLPDVAVLSKLANDFFTALPANLAGPGPNAAFAPAASAPALPGDAQLRTLPAVLAGATGQGPGTIVTAPAAADADAAFYFLRAAQPKTPGVVPALRPDLPGFDPSLSSAVPTAVSSVGPRSAPRRSGFPGSQLASSPPATPGIELGSQPFVGAIPPASAFDLPTEADLGALPALLAGAAGLSPQTGIAAVGAASTGAPHYFLDSAHSTPPRTATLVNLKPRDAAFEFVPELGVSPPPGTPSGVPGSLPAAPTVSAGIITWARNGRIAADLRGGGFCGIAVLPQRNPLVFRSARG